MIELPKSWFEQTLWVLSTILLISSVTIVIYQLLGRDYHYILWFTNFSAIILPVAIFVDHKGIMSGVAHCCIPSEFLWIVSFLLSLFDMGLGRAAGIHLYPSPIFWSSIILHSLLIIVSLMAVYQKGYAKNAINYSVAMYIVFLQPASFLLAPPSANVNCVQFPCDLSADEARSGPNWYFTYKYLAYSDMFWLVSAVASHFAFYYTDRALRNTP